MTDDASEDWKKPASVDYALDEPEFMAEYGRAMASWGGVEHSLSKTFATVVEAQHVDRARAAFHSVISFRDRVAMIDAAMEKVAAQFLGGHWDEVCAEWKRIKEVIKKASGSRNKLAHMHVWHSPSAGTFGSKDITRILELPGDPEERKKLTITIGRMRDYRKSFESCIRRINSFEKVLAEALRDASQPAHLETK